jgi:Lrp/AsnC family leucine-responsive transcriptional regulator
MRGKVKRMDAIDKKLLGLLQQDTKKTTKELSMVLNLSVTAVYERIKKLEREGVISKYVAILRVLAMAKTGGGFVMLPSYRIPITWENFLIELIQAIRC